MSEYEEKASYAQRGHQCTETLLTVFRSSKSWPTEVYGVCIDSQTFTRTAKELERQKLRC